METITDADDMYDLLRLANTPIQAEFLLHTLEPTARGICLLINLDKTEFIYFIQDGTISLLNGKPLKLVNQFIYIKSNISKWCQYIHIGKAWTDIDRLLITWKSDLSDKIKTEILASCSHVNITTEWLKSKMETTQGYHVLF